MTLPHACLTIVLPSTGQGKTMANRRKRPDLAQRNRDNAIHGYAGSRTYRIWRGLRDRCENKENKDFHNYGGRGITVCERWNHSFVLFLEDMGEAPKGMQIDRINNDDGYCKENCRWASIQEQANNKRTCVMVSYKGKTQSVSQWAAEMGLERKTLEYRIRVGWDAERALTTPSTIKRK